MRPLLVCVIFPVLMILNACSSSSDTDDDGNLCEVARLVADINPGGASSNPAGLTVLNEKLYFIAYDGVHGGET